MSPTVAIVERPVDLHARGRCVAAVAVQDVLHQRVDTSVGGVGSKGDDQFPAGEGVGADLRSTDRNVCPADGDVGSVENQLVFGIGAAVTSQR